MSSLALRQRSIRIIVPVVAAALAAACGGGSSEDEPDAATPAVEAVQARLGGLPLVERLTGTVRASGQVAIYPEVSGPIVEVMAQNGDRVRRGDPLVRIRAETSRSQVAQARAGLDVALAGAQRAEANLRELEAQLERTEALAEDSLVSVEALETQRAQVAVARADHAEAQAAVEQARAALRERDDVLDRTVTRSPISGRIGQRNAEVGMRVDAQTPLFVVGRLDSVRVEIPVTQDVVRLLEAGQRVEIRAESLGDTAIDASVSRISPFLQEGSFSAEMEIDVANADGTLLPGMFVTVDVFYGESEQATLVPTSALHERRETGQRGLYVAASLGLEIQPTLPEHHDGTAPLTPPTLVRFQEVEVVAEGRQLVGVGGIEPDTWVVVLGQHLLDEQSEDPARARVRPVSLDRVLTLQGLQREDFLRQFMERQQRLAGQGADTSMAERPSDNGSR